MSFFSNLWISPQTTVFTIAINAAYRYNDSKGGGRQTHQSPHWFNHEVCNLKRNLHSKPDFQIPCPPGAILLPEAQHKDQQSSSVFYWSVSKGHWLTLICVDPRILCAQEHIRHRQSCMENWLNLYPTIATSYQYCTTYINIQPKYTNNEGINKW